MLLGHMSGIGGHINMLGCHRDGVIGHNILLEGHIYWVGGHCKLYGDDMVGLNAIWMGLHVIPTCLGCNADLVGDFGRKLAAILDFWKQYYAEATIWLQNHIPWPQKPIYRYQCHLPKAIGSSVIQILIFWRPSWIFGNSTMLKQQSVCRIRFPDPKNL